MFILNSSILQNIEKRVTDLFQNDSSGHDHFHIQRVVQMSRHIALVENADVQRCELIAWLHEMDDYKMGLGEGNAEALLMELGMERNSAVEIANQCKEISFRGNQVADKTSGVEVSIVQDADRLDAIGAIGIARTFAYGAKRGQALFDPELLPAKHYSFEAYKNAKTTTVNHFYEKLLLLKDRMNTREGKRIATERHDYMLEFLDKFHKEWKAVDI